MKNILLYADDPGGANYLAPLKPALEQAGYRCRFLVASALADFVRQRDMDAEVRTNQSAENLLQQINLVLVGTSEDRACFAHQLSDLAKLQGIPSIGVVDMTVNAARRFQGASNDPLHHAPTWLAVPDDVCRTAYIELGFSPDRVVICGHPYYDVVRSKREELNNISRKTLRNRIYPDAPPDRPVWLFLAEGVDRLDRSQSFRTPEYTLVGRGDSDFRACIVLEELLDATADIHPQPWIALRPHPKTKLIDFLPVEKELGTIDKSGNPWEAVWAADLVVGMTTMLLLETLLLERPHLSIIPRECEMRWLPTLELGLTPFATTREAIRTQLKSLKNDFSGSADRLPSGAVSKVLDLVSLSLNTSQVN